MRYVGFDFYSLVSFWTLFKQKVVEKKLPDKNSLAI